MEIFFSFAMQKIFFFLVFVLTQVEMAEYVSSRQELHSWRHYWPAGIENYR